MYPNTTTSNPTTASIAARNACSVIYRGFSSSGTRVSTSWVGDMSAGEGVRLRGHEHGPTQGQLEVFGVGVAEAAQRDDQHGDEQDRERSLQQQKRADLRVRESGMHEARQPAGGLVRDPREEGQADEPELGARPKRHEERQMGHRQDEDAHREYVEVGHLQEPLVAAGLEEARLGAEVVLDDR